MAEKAKRLRSREPGAGGGRSRFERDREEGDLVGI